MKTAEELLKEKGITPETAHHNYAYVYRAVYDLIGEAQKEAIKDLSENKFNPDDYECLAGVCPDLSDEDHCETCTLKKLKKL